MTSLGVFMPVGVPVETGTGPPVRAPPLLARPAPSSDIWAFSSAMKGVKASGARTASRAKAMAALVRREMRRAGCGVYEVES